MADFLPFVRRWFDATFPEATRPQREGWEAIASGRDTLIVAPTGSGKTLAAFLWALDHLHRLGLERQLEDRVYVVYVSPLRALNNDIEKNLRAPLAGIRAAAAADGLQPPEIRVAVRTGDTLAAQRQAMTRRPPHVLITTPESLFILLTSERFRPALARTRFLIVDEIHALMGSKRGAHLALSLERLQALVEADAGTRPQRIGCSATVSPIESALAFLTGATAADAVAVDAGFTRDLDIQVTAPVDDFLTAPSDTIWEAALQQIAELVQAHRTTLVFAQSRRAAERLARDLNDRIPDGRVAAHHGSLSRRARLEAENRLKQGELRALVATSSLELGIDVGAIDLVVQLQSPRNIAAALQRVGRAGHLLSRTSRGRIVVTKGEELVEAAAVVRSIKERQLDRVVMPDAPLDVLAQQIVASVAAESLTVDALHARLRTAASYRSLERDTLLAVVRSLAEPLPAEVKGAAPRILWDRVNDRLHARRGSRFLALTSGGTIPDNGLYDVFVAETDLKVGTLDEEFEKWAAEVCGLDARAASAMRAWLVKAGEVLDGVPDDQGIVVESFSDEMGGRHAMIHSVFGMRVNGAWGMVLKEKLRRVGLVAEASRECFNDALDVTRLRRLLERLHDGEMWRRHVDTPLPSPFVYPLLLAWDWAYLGAGHAEERRSDAVTMRKAWSVAPGPLRPEIVEAVEAELQKTAPDRRARDANELAGILDDLGDLTDEEIAARVVADAPALIGALAEERRVVALDFASGRRAWVASTDAALYRSLDTDEGLERLALRLLRTRGPVPAAWLAERYGLALDGATHALERLTARGLVRHGAFLADAAAPQFVHIAVLDEIQRRQVHARRVPRPVASAEQFSAFLLRRHHLHPDHRLAGPPGVLASLELLQGEDLSVRVWEQDLLPARVENYEREWLDRLGLAGEMVWTVFDRVPGERGRSTRVGAALRENVGWLRESGSPPPELDARVKNVFLHLQLRGASFAQDLGRATGLSTPDVLAALWELFWAGLVTPDTFSAIAAGTAPARRPRESGGARRRRGQSRGVLAQLPVVGRWSTLGDEEPLSPEEREEARAQLLLARYGVVARELARGDWATMRHTLLRMEYGGEVVRGYFVAGLSGEEYALADALRDLDAPSRRAEPHVLVNMVDPANLWGRVFGLTRRDGSRAAAPRLPQNWLVFRQGRPRLLAEGYGRDLTPLAGWEDVDLPGVIAALQSLMERPLTLRPTRRLEIFTWDGQPIRGSAAFGALVAAGFSADGPRLSWDGYPGPRSR